MRQEKNDRGSSALRSFRAWVLFASSPELEQREAGIKSSEHDPTTAECDTRRRRAEGAPGASRPASVEEGGGNSGTTVQRGAHCGESHETRPNTRTERSPCCALSPVFSQSAAASLRWHCENHSRRQAYRTATVHSSAPASDVRRAQPMMNRECACHASEGPGTSAKEKATGFRRRSAESPAVAVIVNVAAVSSLVPRSSFSRPPSLAGSDRTSAALPRFPPGAVLTVPSPLSTCVHCSPHPVLLRRPPLVVLLLWLGRLPPLLSRDVPPQLRAPQPAATGPCFSFIGRIARRQCIARSSQHRVTASASCVRPAGRRLVAASPAQLVDSGMPLWILSVVAGARR